MSDDWVPKKLEVHIEVPDTLDLEALRSAGVQPDEVLQPETAPEVRAWLDVAVQRVSKADPQGMVAI